MAKAVISTQEVASLLHVTETTVKRWADEGRIPCTRTVGGHRKFVLSDVIEFATDHGIAYRGGTPPELEESAIHLLTRGLESRDFKILTDVFYEEVLKADRSKLYQFLTFVYKHGISFAEIADHILRPAFERIGELWAAGQLDINQEHRASAALIDALIRFAPDLHQKPRNGHSAVCASPSTELHEIGLRTIAYTLESEGWTVQYLGHNTPLESVRSFAQLHKPELICLSLTRFDHRENVLTDMATIATELHTWGGRLALGGNDSGYLRSSSVAYDCLCTSAQDLVRYTREAFSLKPGPKAAAPPPSPPQSTT